MSRSARTRSESGIYHIVLRGVNKQTIFYDDEDREVFLNRLKITKKAKNIKYRYKITNIKTLGKEARNEILTILRNIPGTSIRQISRITGISISIVRYAK